MRRDFYFDFDAPVFFPSCHAPISCSPLCMSKVKKQTLLSWLTWSVIDAELQDIAMFQSHWRRFFAGRCQTLIVQPGAAKGLCILHKDLANHELGWCTFQASAVYIRAVGPQ